MEAWVILGSIPRVDGHPPLLLLRGRAGRHFPFVLATDPSGLLLLSAIIRRPREGVRGARRRQQLLPLEVQLLREGCWSAGRPGASPTNSATSASATTYMGRRKAGAEHRARFADIWADATYAATGLPRKVPIHPGAHPPQGKDPRPASLHARLFAVDVQARKVLHCEPYNLVAPPQEYMANRFLRAWDLPRAVSSGMVNWSNGMSLMSETAACTSSALC
ncbi:hypothetical protein EJB05_32833, partial [Eragrostis curvula]